MAYSCAIQHLEDRPKKDAVTDNKTEYADNSECIAFLSLLQLLISIFSRYKQHELMLTCEPKNYYRKLSCEMDKDRYK